MTIVHRHARVPREAVLGRGPDSDGVFGRVGSQTLEAQGTQLLATPRGDLVRPPMAAAIANTGYGRCPR